MEGNNLNKQMNEGTNGNLSQMNGTNQVGDGQQQGVFPQQINLQQQVNLQNNSIVQGQINNQNTNQVQESNLVNNQIDGQNRQVTQNNNQQQMQQQPKKNNDIVVGEIKADKDTKPGFVFVLFGLLLAFALVLPFVNDTITEYLNSKIPIVGNNNSSNSGNNNNSNNDKEDNKEEKVIVDLNEETSIDYNNVTFSNFNKVEGENYLNYYVKKKNTNSIKDNLYLELYNDENQLLARVRVYFGTASTENGAYNMSSYINRNTLEQCTKVSVVEKNEKDMPFHELETNEVDGLQRMVCKREERELKYSFRSYYLISIEEKDTIIKDEDVDKYMEILNKYQVRSLELNNIDGISSELVTSDSGFTLMNVFDLSKAKVTNLNDYGYYEAGVSAKKVLFEMQAMGYTCS